MWSERRVLFCFFKAEFDFFKYLACVRYRRSGKQFQAIGKMIRPNILSEPMSR